MTELMPELFMDSHIESPPKVSKLPNSKHVESSYISSKSNFISLKRDIYSH
jgi:hypothetical protein